MLTSTLKKFSIITSIIALFTVLFMPVYAGAQPFDPLEQACKKTGTDSADVCDNPIAGEDPLLSRDGVLTQAVNILSLVTAVIAVIVIVVSGIRLITSSGDANAISTARNTIIYAGVGIIVVVMAQTIVRFIAGSIR